MSYMNKRDMFLVCFKPPLEGYGNMLVRHHVSYFPERIAFVHYECHKKIHMEHTTIPHLIQYNEGDSRKFYEQKKDGSSKKDL